MGQPSGASALDASRLRERNVPQQARNDQEAREAVLHLNAEEEKGEKKERDRKTYGRTPNGIVFTVPFTQDMVTQLLSPSEPKNISDLLVLLILALHILALWKLPQTWRIPFFAVVFIFWRASYNLGIGCLLQFQSHSRRLVRWASKWRLFVNPRTGENPHPKLYAFMKRELETKIPKDYSFEQAPIEYNTWLVFRRVVDLILMCDFVSYCLFAMACGGTPPGEAVWATTIRWVVGIGLVVFNLWVKLDAHRVVKDYAWYWGDFFYLIDQELTFDGVFEMAPHPMYSVGYAGYYGISLMAASYKVLFISIAAHAAQFIFLVWVENPHIQRTYNSPSPRKRIQKASKEKPVGTDYGPSLLKDGYPSSVHNLMGWSNIDLYRTSDSSIFVAQILMIAITFLTPSTPFHLALFVINAALWRLWFSIGIGYLLNRQSEKKQWTRHFLKYGESVEEAWRQWKGTYHLSMTMCYASFIAAAWKAYVVPEDWNTGFVLLKHIIGCGLLLLQSWVSVSIYESLGEFGWFYGDFFFDQSPKLTYDGIYRFLNNPERVLGLAGIWGVALITESFSIFCLALFSHIVSLAFIQFVERPHMQKLYGRELRQDAGLVRSLKRSLPPPLRQWQDGMDRFLTETFDSVEDFLGAARPQLAARASNFVKDTKRLYNKYPTGMSIPLSEQDMAGVNREDYSINIEHPDQKGRHLSFEYGCPITIHWTAPINHSPWDWIGLYRISDNTSREVTRLPSFGRWIATNPGVYDSPSADFGQHPSTNSKASPTHSHGSMTFSHSKLFWSCSQFEFRYHHAGKHQVLALSPAFSIVINPFVYPSPNYNALPSTPQNSLPFRHSLENTLLPLIQSCFDHDPEIAPDTPEDTYGPTAHTDSRFAKRVVYAVQRKFGVEFAPEVVRADGNVRMLAWRVWEAKRVLEPYSAAHPLPKRVKKFKRAISEP